MELQHDEPKAEFIIRHLETKKELMFWVSAISSELGIVRLKTYLSLSIPHLIHGNHPGMLTLCHPPQMMPDLLSILG